MVHQLVELWDLVSQRAAGAGLVAEGRAAVHAARALRVELVLALRRRRVGHHLPVVLEPLLLRPVEGGEGSSGMTCVSLCVYAPTLDLTQAQICRWHV